MFLKFVKGANLWGILVRGSKRKKKFCQSFANLVFRGMTKKHQRLMWYSVMWKIPT